MNDAIEKTRRAERKFVPIDMLEANPDNPNEMQTKEFNMLYDNIERMGITDPIFCVPHPTKKKMLRIIGGEHRWEVAKLLNFEEVPVTLVDDKTFTEDEQKFQIVRHNIIHGEMSSKKFMQMYQNLSEEYTQEVAAEMFGFTEEGEFLKLLDETKKGIPKEYHEEFDKAKHDLKTIDDLAILLNKLFAQHGDTLPYGYMIFDFGGKDSVWLRLGKGSLTDFEKIGDACREAGRSMDHVMGQILVAATSDKDWLIELVGTCPEIDLDALPDTELPTLDFLD
jgi:hypothetical protein